MQDLRVTGPRCVILVAPHDMPNFSIKPTFGTTVQQWTDDDTPSRLNSVAARPPLYYEAYQSTTVTVTASVNGVLGPLDAALGGDLFTTSFAEVPIWPAPALSYPAGQSSAVSFIPSRLGMHLLTFRRSNGGAVSIHIYVIEAI